MAVAGQQGSIESIVSQWETSSWTRCVRARTRVHTCSQGATYCALTWPTLPPCRVFKVSRNKPSHTPTRKKLGQRPQCICRHQQQQYGVAQSCGHSHHAGLPQPIPCPSQSRGDRSLQGSQDRWFQKILEILRKILPKSF